MAASAAGAGSRWSVNDFQPHQRKGEGSAAVGGKDRTSAVRIFRCSSPPMDDALHPQTVVATGMNGAELPVPFGGPLRLRVPRQLGYKSVKYITRLTVTDSLKSFGKGLGSASPEGGYAWYAGI